MAGARGRGDAAPGKHPAGMEEAEAHVREACALLEQARPAAIVQAGKHLGRAAQIMGTWQPSAAPSPRRVQLHEIVLRAGKLIEALGEWCRQQQRALFPDEESASCYGVNGRIIPPHSSESVMLQG